MAGTRKCSFAITNLRFSVKVGDLVLFDKEDNPQYAGKTGVITEERRPATFVVYVNGKEHPFFVYKTALEVVSASR